jgi:hypothetical protein
MLDDKVDFFADPLRLVVAGEFNEEGYFLEAGKNSRSISSYGRLVIKNFNRILGFCVNVGSEKKSTSISMSISLESPWHSSKASKIQTISPDA